MNDLDYLSPYETLHLNPIVSKNFKQKQLLSSKPTKY